MVDTSDRFVHWRVRVRSLVPVRRAIKETYHVPVEPCST